MKKERKYNTIVIDDLKSRYGFTRNYIQMSIRGDRKGTIPTQIKDEYHRLDRASRAAIRKQEEKL